MKIRSSFVANSSSSSFICEICGELGEGTNASPSDFDMTYCENGHVICLEHLLDDVEQNEDDVEQNEDYEVSESVCPICQFQAMSHSDGVPYLIETRGITKKEVFDKIKEINKCRKKLYDQEYVKYVFDKFELTEDIFLAELKSKFKTYSDFTHRNQ